MRHDMTCIHLALTESNGDDSRHALSSHVRKVAGTEPFEMGRMEKVS
jgi:hypothetical protein